MAARPPGRACARRRPSRRIATNEVKRPVTRARLLLVALVTVLLGITTPRAPTSRSRPPAARRRPPRRRRPRRSPTRLVVGVGDLPPGFNPHLLADRSPVTTALATLVLPSPFKVAADGTLQLDPTIVSSARIVDSAAVHGELRAQPRGVLVGQRPGRRRGLRLPLAADAQPARRVRMRAGYQLITDVRSRAGGKAVDVVFSQPYPAWQQLFSGLLPAHLLKDAPGSWIGATAGGLPTSGGPFKVVDAWTAAAARSCSPATTPTGTPRPCSTSSCCAGSARRASRRAWPPATSTWRCPEADEAVRTALAGVHARRRGVQQAPQSSVTQLALRADTGPLRDVRVRQALAQARSTGTRCAPPSPPTPWPPTRSASPPPSPATRPPRRRRSRPTRPAPRSCSPRRAGSATSSPAAGTPPTAGPRGSSSARPPTAPTTCGWPQAVATQLRAAGIEPQVVAPSAIDLFAQPTVAPTPPSTGPTAHRRHPPPPRRPPRRGGGGRHRGPPRRRRRPRHRAGQRVRLPGRHRAVPGPAAAAHGLLLPGAAAAVRRADVARAARGQRGRRRADPLAADARVAALPARHASS